MKFRFATLYEGDDKNLPQEGKFRVFFPDKGDTGIRASVQAAERKPRFQHPGRLLQQQSLNKQGAGSVGRSADRSLAVAAMSVTAPGDR
jgi:hypothetical protein